MTRKKVKITIEAEGRQPHVLEANGIAAVMLTDGNDADHHGIQICICGNMSTQDMVYLHEAADEELTNALMSQIVSNMSPEDILKLLRRGGNKHESD